jgi:hypothetical protein
VSSFYEQGGFIFLISSNNNKSITGSLTSSGLHQMQKTPFQMRVAILLSHMIIL